MNKEKFLARLELLLSDVSQEERQDALAYYEDYFDDAGEENEAQVLAELKSPEHVARTIKAGLQQNGSHGRFTETGYEDLEEREMPAALGSECDTEEDTNEDSGKKEYRGPFEYGNHDTEHTNWKSDEYGSYDRDDHKDSRNFENGAGDDRQRNMGTYYTERHSGRKKRPVWAMILMAILGVIVILILASVLFGTLVATVACLGAGIAVGVLGAWAIGMTAIGISLIFLAIFVLALLGEILFCKNVLPEVIFGRKEKDRSNM